MKPHGRGKGSRLLVLASSLSLILSSVYLVAAPVLADQGGKVTICHATHSETNPYVEITVAYSAVDGDKNNDHSHHTGPIWYAGAKADGVDWGDIIPPVPDVNPGQNWDETGQAILANGCALGQGDGECIPASSYTNAELRDLLKAAGSNVADPKIATNSSATSWNADVMVPAELCDVQVSFSAYVLPNGTKLPFEDQVLFDNITGSYAGDSATTVSVDLPDGCGWQVDLYIGSVIEHLVAGQGHPGSKLIDWSINETQQECGGEVEPTPTPTPTATPKPTETPRDEDHAALNIRKLDEQGNRLAGAVFTVQGMNGTFTTNNRGFFCITGLEDDSEWLVTEIQAPEGYVIAQPASQLVEVDDDGDCNSPDAVFVNTREDEEPSATPTPTPTIPPTTPPSEEPTATPTATPTPSATPREGEEGGNPTPKPQGGDLPDTALPVNGSSPNPGVLAAILVALASLSVLAGVQLAEARERD